MAIVWGLMAAIGFGTADVCARFGSEREGTWRTLFYLQLIGLFTAVFIALFSNPVDWDALFGPAGLKMIITSVVMLIGTGTLYRCLVIGPMLITSPIASSFAAVTAVLAINLAGERPSTLQIIGLFFTIAGVALTAASDTSDKRPIRWLSLGVLFALATAVLHGIAFFLLDQSVEELGESTTVLALRIITLAVLLPVMLVTKRPLHLTSTSSLKWLIPVGLLDTLANLFYGFGVGTGLTSVVSVLTALYSVVTVLIGYFWLKENLTSWQKAGVFVVFAGVALVSV